MEEIDEELSKNRSRWYLDSATYISFEDVSQIIRAHIHEKWHLWDQTRDLKPWLNRTIKNQTINLFRNFYGNFAPPCTSCPFGERKIGKDGYSSCSFTKSQQPDNTCKLYANWQKKKQSAYELKNASSIPSDSEEFAAISSNLVDLESALERLIPIVKKRTSKKEFTVFNEILIKGREESEVGKELGYKENSGRGHGYRRIHSIKKKLLEIVKDILKTEDIF